MKAIWNDKVIAEAPREDLIYIEFRINSFGDFVNLMAELRERYAFAGCHTFECPEYTLK